MAAASFRCDQGNERDVSLSWATETISARPAISARAAEAAEFQALLPAEERSAFDRDPLVGHQVRIHASQG